MATLTRNLKLRLSSDLSSDARYNLERIDQLGTTFSIDSNNNTVVRAAGDIQFRPKDNSVGGTGSDGIIEFGDLTQRLSNVLINGPVSLLNSDITKPYYTSIINADTNQLSNKALSILLADPSFLLELPIKNAQVSPTAAIAGSKISPIFTGLVVSGPQGFSIAGSSYSTNLLPATSQAADVTLKLPATAGINNQVLTVDGSGNLFFSNPGSGTVTSVGLVLPSIFTVSNSPVTVTGNLTAVLANQNAKTVLAGPTDSNPAAPPTFRQLSADDLTDGSINRFYSDSLFAASLSTRTTTNLAEGTNLYHTTARARTAAVVNSTAGTQTDQAPSVSSIRAYISALTTSDIAEGANLYYTDLRAQDAAGALVADTATAQLDYISGTSFSVTVLPQGLINSVSGIAESGGILSVSPVQATVKTTPISTDILLIADSAAGNALKKITLADIVTLAGNGFSDTWVAGTTKIITHNLGSRNVMVEVFDNVTYETIYLDSVVRTDTNTITLTASAAPSGAGLTVLVKRIA